MKTVLFLEPSTTQDPEQNETTPFLVSLLAITLQMP